MAITTKDLMDILAISRPTAYKYMTRYGRMVGGSRTRWVVDSDKVSQIIDLDEQENRQRILRARQRLYEFSS